MLLELLSDQKVMFRVVYIFCFALLFIAYAVNRSMKNKKQHQTFFQRHKKAGTVLTKVCFFSTPLIFFLWSIFTKDGQVFTTVVCMLIIITNHINFGKEETA
ncbi:hypothetical protein BK784_21125 [Bacillus thuringiensis serovar medellin]|uniref:Uncharacterized protein n=1 Tax=Bacillus thuringiensis subsp. medellin TaxID=79672 RepID=A0A9X6MX78_BACTV|nr:hypothetical protein [Bacillus thuringiensis]OUB94122.1 hypothetical protein BK784_21125 [Bacillus thuringiensis serovar medellin]